MSAPTVGARAVAEARTWLGTPWRHAAGVKGAGVDCLMLVLRVYQAVGAVPASVDPRPYAIDWFMNRAEERILDGIAAYADEVQAPAQGDVAVYRVGRAFSHAAIVVEWPRQVIHAFRGEGVVLARGDGGALADRPVRFFRLRGAA